MARDARDDPVTAYARAVTDGQILANRLVRLACQRHLDDLGSGASRGLRFDAEAGQHAINFFGFLRHSKGEWAGQTFTLAPWQAFVVGCCDHLSSSRRLQQAVAADYILMRTTGAASEPAACPSPSAFS